MDFWTKKTIFIVSDCDGRARQIGHLSTSQPARTTLVTTNQNMDKLLFLIKKSKNSSFIIYLSRCAQLNQPYKRVYTGVFIGLYLFQRGQDVSGPRTGRFARDCHWHWKRLSESEVPPDALATNHRKWTPKAIAQFSGRAETKVSHRLKVQVTTTIRVVSLNRET